MPKSDTGTIQDLRTKIAGLEARNKVLEARPEIRIVDNGKSETWPPPTPERVVVWWVFPKEPEMVSGKFAREATLRCQILAWMPIPTVPET